MPGTKWPATAGIMSASSAWATRPLRTISTRSRKALEDAAGAAVTGYRAPSFSIDARTPWAFDVLAEQGYAYSSSVAPIAHDHYGWREAPRFAFRPVAGHDLIEMPVTTAQLRRPAPGGGGGDFSAFCRMRFRAGRSGRSTARMAGRRSSISTRGRSIPASRASPMRRCAHAAPLQRLGAMAGKLRRLIDDFQLGPDGCRRCARSAAHCCAPAALAA